MAEKASGGSGEVASQAGGATGAPLSGIIGAIQAAFDTIINWAKSILDQWISPEKRQELKEKFLQFISRRPQLSAFLLSQLALSGIPLALFFTMSLSVLVFALLVGLIVGLLGAVLFAVFCVGLGLIVLLPVLFMTTFLATFIFLWGMGAYYIVKYFNEKKVPGIHTDFVDGMKKQMGLENITNTNGQAAPPATPEKSKQKPDADRSESQKPDHGKKSQAPRGKGTAMGNGPEGDVKKTAAGVDIEN